MSAFRIPAVVELAWVPASQGEPLLGPWAHTPLADRARASASRVGRASYEVREALSSMADVVGGLERELRRLQGVLALSDQGIELRRELAHIGADGVLLQRPVGRPDGETGWIVLSLEVRDAQQLLLLDGRVEGTELVFVDPPQEVRDLLVAFTFQQQARERRRQRAARG